ncbi:MAG: MFS transporter [Pseudomonadota bacterium]
MAMQIVVSLFSLLFAAALLLGSNALHATLLGVRGAIEGFSATEIALLLTAYYVGFIIGCRRVPGIIRDVGHIRAFTAFASIASAAAIFHALYVESWFWIMSRVVTGFSFAALQMIIESWLNERATNENRGRVLSIYRITDFTAVTFFLAAMPLFDPRGFVLFGLLSVLISFALVPVALTRVPAPAVPTEAKLDIPGLWRVSPLAAFGAVMIGLTTSAYWSMSPLFILGLDYMPEKTGLFMGALIFGGALAQWPLGWLSDRVDRRLVIIGTAGAAAVISVMVPMTAGGSQTALVITGLVFGAVAVPGFGLTIAHANDHAEPGRIVAVNGGLLMLYGSAACAGPVIASQVMAVFGTSSLYHWVGLCYLAVAVFGLLRLFARAAPETTEDYVPVMRTTPALFELDPRGEHEDEETGAEEAQGSLAFPEAGAPRTT